MSEFDDFIRGIGSDIKNAAEHMGKKAEETFEISKRRAERISLKGNIQKNYQKLGELVYGGLKNNEDIEEEMKVIVEKLDNDFFRISELYEEINAIRNGTYASEEEDWEEEYAEEYDEGEEMEVSIVVMENNGEIVEEPAVVEEEEEVSAIAEKAQEFDINID